MLSTDRQLSTVLSAVRHLSVSCRSVPYRTVRSTDRAVRAVRPYRPSDRPRAVAAAAVRAVLRWRRAVLSVRPSGADRAVLSVRELSVLY